MFFKHHAATKAWQDDRSAPQCIVTNKLVQRCFSLHTRCVGLWYGTADEKVSTSHLCFSVTIGAAISAEQSGVNIQAARREKIGREYIVFRPYCTLTPGCDPEHGWMLQPHWFSSILQQEKEKYEIRTKKKKLWKIQIPFNNSFLVQMKLVQLQLCSTVTPPISLEHCAPGLFDTRAGAGDWGPETPADPFLSDLTPINCGLPHTRRSETTCGVTSLSQCHVGTAVYWFTALAGQDVTSNPWWKRRVEQTE